MTLLKRATIKSYDAGSHRAAVGISGSLSVWLDSIAISDAIAAASVVAGRECAVLFHTDDNPDDAVIVSVHGGGPPAAGGTPLRIQDADADTIVDTSQYDLDLDTIRFTNAGTLSMELDASGNLTLQSGGALTLDKVTGHGIGAAGTAESGLKVAGTIANSNAKGLLASPTIAPTADGGSPVGLYGQVVVQADNWNINSARGLYLTAVAVGGGTPKTIAELLGADVGPGKLGGGYLTIADMVGLRARATSLTATNTTITRWANLWADYAGNSVVGVMTGLQITDVTAGTNKYLMWAGPNVPSATGLTNLRLDAGNPPNAGLATEGDSQLYLTFNENGSLVMRQLRWRRQSSLNAADKVLIAQ